MGSAWDRMGALHRTAMLLALTALVAAIISVAASGDWSQMTRGLLGLAVFIWLLAPVGAIRDRTTGRLSPAQGLAIGLVASVAYVLYHVVTLREVPLVAGAIVLVGLVGFFYLLASEGWSE